MPTNSESLNRELFRLLSKYKPKPLDAEGKATPVPDEADIFKFEFTKDGEDYGTVYVTLDEDRVLTVYFGDDVSDSPDDKTPGLDYDDTWSGLLHQLSAWRMTKGLRGFKTQNKDRVSDDMARRNHMRNKDKIAEGYYPMGKSRSYSDAVPSVKIVIEHSRVIEEGEQRYRNINRIFLENQAGERYLLDTKKPGIARVYARHIAEGGKVNDDRWNHVHSLCEEYSKMAGFVRATRNGQFNESAQSLVNEGIAHYQSLRESLSRMTGKRGYNAYFENWTPSLMEDEGDETNLNELFVQETLDPRIESVMPILNRIHKKVSESIVDKEMNKLAEWADRLVEGPAVDANANSPTGSQSPALAHYADQLDHDASVQEDEGMFGRSKNDKRYLDKFDPTEVMNISDDPGMKAHRTTRQGSLRTSKKDLEFAFGPSGEDDTWVLEFRNGLIATVYPNPNSNFGMDWFIGGNHPDIEDYVLKAYSAAINDLEEGVAEDKELAKEFDLIESIVEMIAEHNGVDAEAVWEDLESLTEDELYVFAVTSDPLMEDWQKANKRDKTDGMSQKAVNAYRRENPGSKLKTAVTTKPGKLKKGGKASKRRKSYCSRSRGQMKMHSISCAKTPDKAICKARRRWNC